MTVLALTQHYISQNSAVIKTKSTASPWNPGAIFLRETTGLPRTFVSTNKNRTYLLLNRQKEGDRLLAPKSDNEKRTITIAICIETGERYSATAQKSLPMSVNRLKKGKIPPLQCFPQSIQTAFSLGDLCIMEDWVVYEKKGMVKSRFFTPLAESDLFNYIQNRALKFPDRTRKLAISCIKQYARWAEKAILHRDLKEENFLVFGDEVRIVDWESANVPCTGEYRRITLETFSPYLSKIFLEACDRSTWREACIKAVNAMTPACEIWALGLLLRNLFFPYACSNKTALDYLSYTSKLKENWWCPPAQKETLTHLISQMLQIKPEKRPTAKELLAIIEANPKIPLK